MVAVAGVVHYALSEFGQPHVAVRASLKNGILSSALQSALLLVCLFAPMMMLTHKGTLVG